MKLLVGVLLFCSQWAYAAYDETWYEAPYFTGEYPNGFSVIAKGATVPGRMEKDKDVKTTLTCPVEFKAVYHAWNEKDRGDFVTMSKIVPLTVKKDFVFEDPEGAQVPLKQGAIIEYLVYGAEGWFLVRINGQEYAANQDLFDHVEKVDPSAFQQHEWMQIACGENKNAWISMDDLVVFEGCEERYLPGLDTWYRGFREYGVVTDLTDKDLGQHNFY